MKKLSVLFALLAVAMMAKAEDLTLTAQPFEIEPDGTAMLTIVTNQNVTDFAAYQFQIDLPEGLTFVEKVQNVGPITVRSLEDVETPVNANYSAEYGSSFAAYDHTFNYTLSNENKTVRIVVYSNQNSKLLEGQTILKVKVQASADIASGEHKGAVKISDVVFATEGSESGATTGGVKPADSTSDFTVAGAAETTITLKITDAQYSTLILPFDYDLPEGLKASTVEWPETGNELVETEVTDGKLLAGVPYLMFGEEVKTYTFTGVPTYAEETGTAGAMVGVLAESTVPAGCYVLQKQDGKVAFYKVTKERAFHANRCYLIAKPNGANMYRIGGTTGIDEVTVEEAGDVYDMLGRKVIGPLEKGVYIKNNRKIYVK